MSTPPPAPRPKPFRLTTGTLMVWVLAVAVVLGFLKGDVAEWVPTDLLLVLTGGAVLATAVGIPWLSSKYNRSAEPYRPSSAAALRWEGLAAVGCVVWLMTGICLLGALCYLIFTRS